MNDLIEKLSNLRSQFNCFDEHERDAYHILSEAIKVLSERPEPCEDAVSREDAIDTLDDEITITGKSNAYVVIDYVQRVKRKLENLPSVIPKSKTGKWIRHPEWKADGECGYECDQCGMGSDVDYNFCMRCGAKMEE